MTAPDDVRRVAAWERDEREFRAGYLAGTNDQRNGDRWGHAFVSATDAAWAIRRAALNREGNAG